MARRPSRASKRPSARAALLDAAVAEFTSKGYEAATVAGIAARAGVTTGSVYSHFKSKLELLLEAVGLSTVEAFTRRSFAIAGKPVSEVAPALARGLVGPSGGRRDLLLIDAIVLARRDPNVAEGYRRVIRAHVEAFERTARLGVESGRIDPVLPIDELGRLVLSLAFGVMALRALEQAPPADATVARLVEQLLQPASERKPEERVLARVQSRARGRAGRGRPARADRAGRRRGAQPAQDRGRRGSVSRADPSHPHGAVVRIIDSFEHPMRRLELRLLCSHSLITMTRGQHARMKGVAVLKTRGLNHIDLGTRDMEATRKFYEDVLGFPLVRADLIDIVGKGTMRHYFFDAGNGQLIGFMSGEDVQGFPNEFDTSINKGLGLPPGVYHFAFDAESESDLERIKHHLVSNGVAVNGPVNHEGWSKSIYFTDPNGLQLEVCHLLRPFVADDAVPRVRFRLEGRRKVELESEAP